MIPPADLWENGSAGFSMESPLYYGNDLLQQFLGVSCIYRGDSWQKYIDINLSFPCNPSRPQPDSPMGPQDNGRLMCRFQCAILRSQFGPATSLKHLQPDKAQWISIAIHLGTFVCFSGLLLYQKPVLLILHLFTVANKKIPSLMKL